MPQLQVWIDTIAVAPVVGGSGVQATVVAGQDSHDRKARLMASGPGVYIASKQFSLAGEGYALSSTEWTEFELPSGSGIWAISVFGTQNIFRFVSHADVTSDDTNNLLAQLIGAVTNTAVQAVRQAVPSALEAFSGMKLPWRR